MTFDEKVLDVFIKNQRQLFIEDVATNHEEAQFFLEDVCACVCDNYNDLKGYLDDVVDITGMSKDEILDCAEVFDIGDGRYLVVEG